MDKYTHNMASANNPNRLKGEHLSYGYDSEHPIFNDLDIAIPDGLFTAIIGPNGCGKSTVLKTLARIVQPQAGHVILDGQLIQKTPTKEIAKRLGILPQSPIAPEGISVSELVTRGRYPYQDFLGRSAFNDQEIVDRAMQLTHVDELADRQVDTLSGGQKQRVWIAMVLAQQTPLILLDEPTTFLDLSHQINLLELLSDLNKEEGRTLVAVLHDLNQACRYADHLIVMKEGRIEAQGAPDSIITSELIEYIFDMPNCIIKDPVAGTPLIVPLGRYK